MATHWIVTNRNVVRDPATGRECVDDFDAQGERMEALPTFRVAEFKTAGLPGAPTPADLDGAVEFVPDTFQPGYEELSVDTDPALLPGSQRMFKSLYDQMCAAPAGKGDTLFMIHGFNYTWPDALVNLHRIAQIYSNHAATTVTQIVFFTWPSWGALRKYWKDQQIAAPSGQLLGRIFGKLVRFYEDFFDPEKRKKDRPDLCHQRIHIAAHSMGNQVLREFMRSIVDYDYLRHPVFGEAFLLNADIEWTALSPGEPLYELATYSDRVHVYNHYSDDALRHSALVKNPGEKRLGQYGPASVDTNVLPPRTVVLDCSSVRPGIAEPAPVAAPSATARETAASVLAAAPDGEAIAAAARILDRRKTDMRERLFDHWGYLHRPEVIADIWQVLAGKGSSAIEGREPKPGGGPLYKLKDQ